VALLEQQTRVVVAVVDIQAQAVVVLALYLFVMPILTQPHLQPQVHQQSQWLVAIALTNGQAQGVSHSDGTLCKNQF
jgi:hypothetical protein